MPSAVREAVKVKGHVVASVVAALQGLGDRGRDSLPSSLHGYLEEPILASVWYPIEDHLALLAAWIPNMRQHEGRDPYVALGRITARRDLRGDQDNAPAGGPTTPAGIYRGIGVFSQSLANLVSRALRVRRLYYSAGHYTARRTEERALRIVFQDFPVVSAPICALTTGYFVEVFQSASVGTVQKVSCRAKGQAECAWELRLGPEVDVSELSAFE